MADPVNGGGWQDVPNTTGTAPGAPPNPPPGYAPTDYPPPQQGYVPPPPPPQGYVQPQGQGLSPNAAAAISYITFIPAIIFLVMEPYKREPFVRFHSIQCIALSVVAFVVQRMVGLIFLSSVVTGSWAFGALLHSLVSLAFFILWLVCIVSAAQGKWFKIPVLGDMALKWSRNP